MPLARINGMDPSMINYPAVLAAIQNDSRYQENLDWGKPRAGHPEGTVRDHITEIERNLKSLDHKLTKLEFDQLRVLIHTHDTFKADAKQGVPILDPRSHASLARAFLSEFCPDENLLSIVQFHDEPYALWNQIRSKGNCNADRLQKLFHEIRDWNLFLAFNIIDGCTEGKTREPVQWLFDQFSMKVDSRFTRDDIL